MRLGIAALCILMYTTTHPGPPGRREEDRANPLEEFLTFKENIASTGFEKKLARYALAGSAALGLPFAAQAGVVYSGPINQVVTADSSYDVNFDNPLVIDFTITANGSAAPAYVAVSGPGTTMFVNSSGSPAAMNFGDLISLANATGPGGGDLMRSNPTSGFPVKSGNWQGSGQGTTAYLGVQFDISGQAHLGWAQITTSVHGGAFGGPVPAQATLVDFAYEDQANTSITAGAVGSSVPEPSTLAMFALGATGLLAARRRRKAVN